MKSGRARSLTMRSFGPRATVVSSKARLGSGEIHNYRDTSYSTLRAIESLGTWERAGFYCNISIIARCCARQAVVSRWTRFHRHHKSLGVTNVSSRAWLWEWHTKVRTDISQLASFARGLSALVLVLSRRAQCEIEQT
jgi:hypothetical protein